MICQRICRKIIRVTGGFIPHYKNYLEVERETEKRLYRICKELEQHGESQIDNAMTPEWHSTLKKLGIRAKPLVDAKLLEPIWKTTNKNNIEKRLIRIPKGVVIEEIKGNKKSFFPFKRPK